jgi:hypothetical protein
MRILMMILAILAFVVTAFIGGLATTNGFGEDADKAAKMVTQMEKLMGADNPKVVEMRTVVSGYKTSSIGAALSVLLGLAGLVLMFMKKEGALLKVLGAAIVVAVIFTILSPGVDTGDKMNPRLQAMIPGIAAALTAFFALIAEKKRNKA